MVRDCSMRETSQCLITGVLVVYTKNKGEI